MRQTKIRFANEHDNSIIRAWMCRTKHSDQRVLMYPTTKVLCVYDHQPVAYLPTQSVRMLESTAIGERVTEMESAAALRDLVKGAELVAESEGVRELYFLGTDERLNKVAVKHGFEQLPWPVLRMRLR
jgi:hypothetical protein